MSDPSLMTLVGMLPTYHYWKRRRGKNPSHIESKLKKQHVEDHLAGRYAIGLSPIRRGHDNTRVALFDLDNHNPTDIEDVADVRFIADEIVAAGEPYGLEATVFTSSGGNGIHVYFVWDEPQDAYSVRQLLGTVLDDCLLIEGTGGLEKNQVEIFPKQDSVPKDGHGSMFILPYAFESEWLAGSWFPSREVPVISRPKEASSELGVAEEFPLHQVESAVEALPNEDLDYDAWRNIIFAIHAATDGSEKGLELAREWSSKSSKHDDAFFSERVWPYVKAGKGITARTLIAHAHAAGWNDDVLEMFDDLPPEDAPGDPLRDPHVDRGNGADDARLQTTKDKKSPGAKKDLILPSFSRDNKGNIESTIVNLQAALRAAMMSGGQLGFDDFTQQQMINRKGNWIPLRESSSIAMRLRLEKKGFKPIAKDAFRDVLLKVCEETTFDSAQEWLRSLQWDGVPRVDTFLSTYFGAPDTAYHRAVGRYWWSAAAGRICVPGIQADMVPVLVGPQGLRKSTALVSLVPSREHLIEIDLTARDADLSRIMQGAILGEIAELRGLNSREDEHIKAFITRTQEKWVPKYQEYPRVFNRRLLFVGTTNNSEFLSDHSGNRRWLPIDVGTIDRERIVADRDQIWAEGVTLFDEHGVIFGEAEQRAEAEHSQFEIEDPWERTVAHYLTDLIAEHEGAGPVRCAPTEVLVFTGLVADLGKISRGHHMRLARVFRKLGWKQVRVYDRKTNSQYRAWEKVEDELV